MARKKMRQKWDVEYYAHKKKRKKPIAGATVATDRFLVIVHEENPEYTISQLRNLLTDKERYILEPDAIAVLDAYIAAGEAGVVPEWK